jgi:hypothetical protein
MGHVQAKWEDEECRFEDGIFFSDDTFISLAGSYSQGYQAAVRQPLQSLMEANPDGWTALDPVCSAEYHSILIVGGGGSYESDGFLAVVDASTRRLVWLLHLSGVEPFTEVRVDGSLLRATSAEYPFRHEWTIPLESPHALLAISSKEC